MTNWTSMAMRPNTTSTEGQVPVSGDITSCPDIIPLQAPDPNPTATFSTPASWSTTYPGQVAEGAPNYLYVRAKNWAAAAETATVTMYAVGCALIQWPSQWLNSPLSVQTGGTSITLTAQTNQQIVVGSEPFYWQAPPPPPGSDHYCLFALLDSPDNPNQLLHGDVPQTYSNMADLVTNELYVGWKNVAEVASNVPTWTQQMQMPLPPRTNPNDQLHVYFFGSAGLVNSQVAISSGDGASYSPPINITPTTIVSPSDTYGIMTKPVAGQTGTVLNVSWYQGSSNPSFTDRVSVVCGWVPSSAEEAKPFRDRGAGQPLPEEFATDDIGWEVAIGAMHYVFSA